QEGRNRAPAVCRSGVARNAVLQPARARGAGLDGGGHAAAADACARRRLRRGARALQRARDRRPHAGHRHDQHLEPAVGRLPQGAAVMNASVPRPPQTAPLAKRLPLYLLIACLPFTDFVQNGLTAFNAAPVMGDIGASPEEYSLVATLYAVMAIAMISQHRWLVERLGWRLLVQPSCALFAI